MPPHMTVYVSFLWVDSFKSRNKYDETIKQ